MPVPIPKPRPGGRGEYRAQLISLFARIPLNATFVSGAKFIDDVY